MPWLNPRNAIIVLVAALSVFAYGQAQYHRGRQAMKAEVEAEYLRKYVEQTKMLHSLEETLAKTMEELSNAEPKVIKEYQRVVVEKPLPADCRIDSDRLRNINTATKTANAHLNGNPLPTNRGGDK